MMVSISNDAWLNEVSYYIRKKYSIEIKVQKTYLDDPLDLYFIVAWNNYRIKIPESEIGPARVADFIDIFNKILKEQYPELLL